MLLILILNLLSMQASGTLDSSFCLQRIQTLAGQPSSADKLELFIETYTHIAEAMPLRELRQLLADPLQAPTPSALTSESYLAILRRLVPLAHSSPGSDRIKSALLEIIRREIEIKRTNAKIFRRLRLVDSPFAKLGVNNAIYNILIDPKGENLYTASKDGRIGIWDITKKIQKSQIQTGTPHPSLLISKDQETLFAVAEHTVNARINLKSQISGPFRFTRHIALHSNGSKLFGTGSDESIDLIEASNGDLITNSAGDLVHIPRSGGSINKMLLTSDDKFLIYGTSSGHIIILHMDYERLYEMKMSLRYAGIRAVHDDAIVNLLLSRDEHTLYSSSEDKTLRFLNARNAEQLTHDGKPIVIDTGTQTVYEMATSFDGRILFASNTLEIKLFDAKTGRPIRDENDNEITISDEGKEIISLASHPKLPIIFFGTIDGNIISLNLHDILPTEYWEKAP